MNRWTPELQVTRHDFDDCWVVHVSCGGILFPHDIETFFAEIRELSAAAEQLNNKT